MHNAGNDAFMCLFALQVLFEPTTRVPNVRKARGLGVGLADPRQIVMTPTPPVVYPPPGVGSGGGYIATNGVGYLVSPQPQLGYHSQQQHPSYTGAGAYPVPALLTPPITKANANVNHHHHRKSHSPPMQNLVAPASAPAGKVQQQYPPPSISESESGSCSSASSSMSAETSSASMAYDLAGELGRMQVERTRTRSPAVDCHGKGDKGKPKEEKRLSGAWMGAGVGAKMGLEPSTKTQNDAPAPSAPRKNAWIGRGGAPWKK